MIGRVCDHPIDKNSALLKSHDKENLASQRRWNGRATRLESLLALNSEYLLVSATVAPHHCAINKKYGSSSHQLTTVKRAPRHSRRSRKIRSNYVRHLRNSSRF
jgi:hypothetical protein